MLKEAQLELAQLNAENERLKLRLDEVQTPEWQEEEIREKLGYGKPGETVLILPENEEQEGGRVEEYKEPEANWRKWWKLYIRR